VRGLLEKPSECVVEIPTPGVKEPYTTTFSAGIYQLALSAWYVPEDAERPQYHTKHVP